MSAAWAAAIVAIVLMTFTAGGNLWRSGRYMGRQEEILRRLTEMTEDHETRLRNGGLL